MNPNDELHDKLLDCALREVIGGQAPPDLKDRIVASAMNSVTNPANAVPRGKRNRNVWIAPVVAACVLIAGSVLLPAFQPAAETAKRRARQLTIDTSPAVPVIGGSQRKNVDSPRLGREIEAQKSASPATSNQFGQSLPPAGEFAAALGRPVGNAQQTPAAVPPEWGMPDSLKAIEDQQGTPTTLALQTPNQISAGAPWSYQKSAERLEYEAVQRRSVASRGKRHALYRYGEQAGAQAKVAYSESLSKDRYWNQQLPVRESKLVPGAQGEGPDLPGDQYTRIYENPFIEARGEQAVSTFSIDVDTASYANVRQFLQSGQLPPPDAVRLEELINYFDYQYEAPAVDSTTPFSTAMEVAGCPWAPKHRLIRVALQGRELDKSKRPVSNLVFLIDVSGSMDQPNKLPLVVEGMKQLVRELGETDRVAIVVYASSEGLVLPSTPGTEQSTILAALDNLRAGGSTAGGAGIQLAYQMAEDHFVQGGVNRVILCTDGDFNVGVTSTADLERMVEQKAKDTKVFLSVLGFGRGNLNDAMMEAISNHGNGNYHYVDNLTEAKKVLVEEMTGTLVTIAKDVKIQVEFNPAQVAGYRLLGYENRMLLTEDFNDDKKDAGEIGAGHRVTALYEIVPAGEKVDLPPVDDLKYQQPAPAGEPATDSKDLLTLKLRFKPADGDTSTKVEFPLIDDEGKAFGAATDDFKFAAAVASFGMLLRNSEHKGNATFDAVLEIGAEGAKHDPHGYRAEFLELVRKAKGL
jgi:Ca-activated chloride channel family protein